MPKSLPQQSPAKNGRIHINTLSDLGEFRRHSQHWDTVVDACPNAPVHVCSVWIEQWWESFGRDTEVLAILLEDAEGPLGVAPFLRTYKSVGGLRIPTLRLLGNELCERSEIILNRRREAAWDALQHYLDQLSWAFFDYGWGAAESAERRALSSSEWPYSIQSRQALELPLVALSSTWPVWLGEKSRTFRKSLRKAEEKCAGLKILRFPDDFDDFERLLSMFQSVALESWSHAEGTSIVSSRAVQSFFSGLLRDFHAREDVLASVVMRGNEPQAFAFGIAFGTSIFGLKTSYRADIQERSLGTRVMADFVEHCMAGRGKEILDMDCVTVHSTYKKRWANELVRIVDQRIFRRRPLSGLLSLAYRIKKRPTNTSSGADETD